MSSQPGSFPQDFDAALLGASAAMQALKDDIMRAAAYPEGPTLITGATGTGKALVAEWLHKLSPRRGYALVTRCLTQLRGSVGLGELVGYRKGAFTGAHRDHTGAFELAHRSTLFLDELHRASPLIRGSLLELTEGREVRRMGETRSRRYEVYVISATNLDLAAEVAAGRFPADLYYRLRGVALRVPSLAERRDDIPLLIRHYLTRLAATAGVTPRPMPPEYLTALMQHPWPGNVRDLIYVLRQWFVLGRFPDDFWNGATVDRPARIETALVRHDGCKAKAAREVGISRQTIYRHLAGREKAGEV